MTDQPTQIRTVELPVTLGIGGRPPMRLGSIHVPERPTGKDDAEVHVDAADREGLLQTAALLTATAAEMTAAAEQAAPPAPQD